VIALIVLVQRVCAYGFEDFVKETFDGKALESEERRILWVCVVGVVSAGRHSISCVGE
jgi:hypothetical protein